MMKIMLKKILGLILAVSLFAANTIQVSAAAPNEKLPETDIQNVMLQILSSVEFEKEYYGLGDVDFSSVTIGEKIPTYEVVDSQLKEFSRHIFPVLSNGTMISQFFAVRDSDDGKWYVQLDDTLVKGTLDIVGDQPYAYIYDDNGIYVYCQKEVYLLGEAEKEMAEEDWNPNGVQEQSDTFREESGNTIDAVPEENLCSVECTKAEGSVVLNVIDYMAKLPVEAAGEPTSAYLPVQIIKQPQNTHICWAIACTSILNYIFKSTYDYQQIVNLFGQGVDTGMSAKNVLINLNTHFNLNYTLGKSTPGAKKIISKLAAGYPIYGAFYNSKGDGHAVVIRGCDKNKKTFSVMNPNPNTNSYTTGNYTSDKVWSFISSYSKNTLTLKQHLFRN